MSLKLTEYAEQLRDLPAHCRASLEANWVEATRVFSPRGLDHYLKGTLAVQRLGRGESLVQTWIEEAPLVAKAIGEDVVPELASAALALASKTSGAVIERLLATAPTAADRLGDAELFRQYLQFVNTLVARAPRGVRPMLDKLEVLLRHLTLGGLRRWAMWGAHAYRTDYEEQVRYFGLETKESLAVLQKERKGTLFVDVQRRLNMYLRALWGRDFFMRPTSGDVETRQGYRPYIESYLIHLPDAFDDFVAPTGARVAAVELYRATAAHCAAHVVYTREPMAAQGLTPLQRALVDVVEDARVEALAIRRFPGLKRLWSSLHTATPAMDATFGHYLDRLARALLDETYVDGDAWVARGRALFAAARDRLESNQTAWDIGVELAHQWLAQRRLPYQPRTDTLSAPYRDDNRYVWAFQGYEAELAAQAGYAAPRQVRKYVSLMEMVNEVDNELAGDDAQEIWVLPTEFFLDQEGVSINSLEGKEPVSPPVHYPEWDYQIQLERPAWVSVVEKRPASGELSLIEAILARHRREIQRMKYLLDALQPQGVQRIRKLEDGDEIDINAAIVSFTDIRRGLPPDPRIMMRSVRKVRDVSILVLLDLSASTNETVHGQDQTVLDLTREACVLLADAIDKVGDAFAIHGFCSDGRHEVEYFRFKHFDEPWGTRAQARLAGMTGQRSTRMGAAIRHAGHHLGLQRTAKKLLIVVTDGEPADVDVRDPQYLRWDAKKAIETVARQGIVTFCISLDPRADAYVARIFGQNHYTVIDRVQRLPEKLPRLYAALTR